MLRLEHLAVFLLLAAVNGFGCAITFQHGDLDSPAVQAQRGPLHHSSDADGLDRRVGWGRFTVFAIPIVPIYVMGDDGQTFMRQVRDALEVAGYEPIAVSPGEAVDAPVLYCKFGDTSFSNYTWLFPFVPTWGSITATATLVQPDGTILWSQQFTGDGFTANFFNGYNSSAKQSVTEILNAMILALVTEDFRLALSSGSRSSPPEMRAELSPTESGGESEASGLPEVSSEPSDDVQPSPTQDPE